MNVLVTREKKHTKLSAKSKYVFTLFLIHKSFCMTQDRGMKDSLTDTILKSQFQLDFTVMTTVCMMMMMGSAVSGDRDLPQGRLAYAN
jgi:hypothetical protein